MEELTQKLSGLLRNITEDSKHEEVRMHGMTLNEYQELSKRTANEHDDQLNEYVYGLAGEVGEVIDVIKKWKYHMHEDVDAEVAKELGDVLWYVTQLADLFGVSLEEVAQGNVKKLADRYPEGFSQEASRNRKEGE